MASSASSSDGSYYRWSGRSRWPGFVPNVPCRRNWRSSFDPYQFDRAFQVKRYNHEVGTWWWKCLTRLVQLLWPLVLMQGFDMLRRVRRECHGYYPCHRCRLFPPQVPDLFDRRKRKPSATDQGTDRRDRALPATASEQPRRRSACQSRLSDRRSAGYSGRTEHCRRLVAG